MILTGLARLGRDAELRTTPKGEPVATLALAYNYGQKGDDGKKPSQWIEAALWGKRAEALAQYLLKGAQVSVVLDDVHIEEFERKGGGWGAKLRGRVVDIEFAGSRADAPRTEPKPAPKPKPQGSGFDDMDDDPPF